MHWTSYIIPILFSTFTGWFTIWLILTMLFRPHKPVRIFGVTIQGIFPKKQPLIAEKLGQWVGKELFSFAEIEGKVTNPENLEKLKPEIEKHIDDFLRERLPKVFPVISMFIGDKTINQLKGAFLNELEELFPVLMKNYMNKLEQDIDIEKMVREKIAGLSSQKLESILRQSAKKELRQLLLAGAAIGFVIGLLQVAVAFFTV